MIVTVAVEVALAAGLVALGHHPDLAVGWGDLGAWLAATTPEVVLMAAAYHVALAATAWLLLTTAAYAAARVLQLPAAALIGRTLLPGVKRIVDRAIVAAAVAAVTGLPAPAFAGEPAAIVPPGTVAVGYRPAPAAPAQSHADGPEIHVVRRGDSFWRIAAARVPGEDVAAYWVQLVKENRGSIRSGDPDLIFPGEVIRLPPPNEAR